MLNPPYPPAGGMPAQPGPAPKPWWALAGAVPGVWLGAFVFMTGTGLMFHELARVFHTPPVMSWLVLVVYLVTGAVGLGLVLLLGRRWPEVLAAPAAALMVPGELIGTFAVNAGMLVVGRAVTGLGAGALAGAAVAILVRVAPKHRTVAAVVSGVPILFAMLAGFLFSRLLGTVLSFRMVYLLAAILAVIVTLAAVAMAIVYFATRKPTGPTVPPRMPPPAGPPGVNPPGA